MDPNVQPEVSATMPVVPDAVRKLVLMLDEQEGSRSKYSMDAIFNKLLDSELVTNPGWPLPMAKIDTPGCRRIFHQLSRPFLRSILLNTVGKDLYDPSLCQKNFRQVFSLSAAGGCYVAAMYIAEREGKFLNSRETEELIECLESYVRAIEVNGTVNMPADDESAYKTARAIDAANKDGGGQGADDHGDFEFEGTGEFSAQKVVAIKALIEMFKARITTSSHAHHIQSPLMVGNAGRIDKRVSSHFPDRVAKNTPKTWGLVWSCLKYLGLDVRMTWAPVTIALEKEDINNGEILGTILAGSMLPGRGYNVKAPGTRGVTEIQSGHMKAALDHVFSWGSWFADNLRRSMLDRPLSTVSPPGPDPALEQECIDLIRKVEDGAKRQAASYERLRNTREECLARYRQLISDIEQDIAEIDAFVEEWVWPEFFEED